MKQVQNWRQIKQETNTIRIIASESVLKTLNLLESGYDREFEELSVMLQRLPNYMQENDQKGIIEDKRKIEEVVNVILKHKNNLIQQMRVELNEI